MPDTSPAQHQGHMLDKARTGLEELATGRFAERMRNDMATRLMVAIGRVLLLRRAGLMGEARPRPAQRRAVVEIERIAALWPHDEMTAAEFVGDLPPAEVLLLCELAPAWAAAMSAEIRR